MTDLKSIVTTQARAAGFDLVGVTSADDFAADRDAALERIREGRMDGLPWYTESRVMRGTSPAELLPGARSIICLGLSYWQDADAARSSTSSRLTDGDSGRRESDSRFRGNGGAHSSLGRVARYAWVRDYHRAMKRRMRELVRALEREMSSEVAARWYVDDGPMLDRAAANRAGIGWFGKNSNILNPLFGSWVFLGQIITDLDLEPDAPLKKSCGNCTRCIDDCPTGAIVAPYVVDNPRCISYLTIENRGAIPREMRPLVQDWVFGCDICQDVCPVNRKAREAGQPIPPVALDRDPDAQERIDLVQLLEMSEDEFRQRFAGSSIMRAKRVGMQRNACVALGNIGDESAVPALAAALASAEPLVRGHAAWALGRIGGSQAAAVLSGAASAETDAAVLEEIRQALAESAGG